MCELILGCVAIRQLLHNAPMRQLRTHLSLEFIVLCSQRMCLLLCKKALLQVLQTHDASESLHMLIQKFARRKGLEALPYARCTFSGWLQESAQHSTLSVCLHTDSSSSSSRQCPPPLPTRSVYLYNNGEVQGASCYACTWHFEQ